MLATGCIAAFVLLVGGYLFFVLTPFGQRLDYAGYFGRGAENWAAKGFDGKLLSSVTPAHIFLVAAVIALIGALRRQPLTGGIAAVSALAAIFGAEALKAVLPHPELVLPPGPVPPYFSQDTYPSGHTTVGAALSLAFLLASPAPWRKWASVFAGLVSAAFGTAVLFLGWHRPSDAVGGILWSGFCVGTGGLVLLLLKRKNPALQPMGAAFPLVVGIMVCAGAAAVWWISGNITGNGIVPGCCRFVFFSAAIVFFGLLTSSWLGFALSPYASRPQDRWSR